jgi:hypothetical protein
MTKVTLNKLILLVPSRIQVVRQALHESEQHITARPERVEGLVRSILKKNGCLQLWGGYVCSIKNAVLITTFFGFPQIVAAVETHCTKNETIVFNCKAGSKIVSVCSSKTVTSGSGYLQYRFGPKKKLELIYPENQLPPAKINMQAETLTFAGGGGAYLRFKREEYGYVIYTAIGRGWGEKAGVVVEKDNVSQVNLPCKKPVISALGPDFFEQAGILKDQLGFEIP